MDYTVEYRKSSLPMKQFRARYQDAEKFLAYCKECPKYGTVWSCPPLSFDADAYLARFAWVNIVGAKIQIESQVIEAADTPAKIRDVGWKIVSAVKLDVDEKMRGLEAQYPESVSLSSGGCILCDNCTRQTGKPCRQPDKMRYSLDAFGFDLSAITSDMLNIDIQWCKERLPDYFTLVHGIMTMDKVTDKIWSAMKIDFMPCES